MEYNWQKEKDVCVQSLGKTGNMTADKVCVTFNILNRKTKIIDKISDG